MKEVTKKITWSAMFMAIGFVLPFFTGQIPRIGNMLLPMHIPVFLCGLICGWKYGGIIGFLLPLMRSIVLGMPVLYPSGISMAFELATYGLVAGFLYETSRWKCVIALYRSILTAMIMGRMVWGLVQVVLLGLAGGNFSWKMFMAGAFFNAIPGIIIQLTLLPVIMLTLKRTGLVQLYQSHSDSGMMEN